VRESFADLFHGSHVLRDGEKIEAVCITTNGATRRSDGAAVMGRGCALQAKQQWPGLEHTFGALIHKHGNHVQRIIRANRYWIVSFPVKHSWQQPADVRLIERSARELMELADREGWKGAILLPRPGCGNGRLLWVNVRKFLEPIVDDRVVIVAQPHEAPGAVRCMLCGSGTVTKTTPCERCGSTWDDVQETEPDPHGWGD
jgi:hypothetical protein